MTSGGVVSSNSRISPLRSYLYAPADRPDVVVKALASDAHVVVIDLEDGLRDGDSVQARRLLRDLLTSMQASSEHGPEVHVRCSRATDGFGWSADDLAAAVGPRTSAIRLAKAEHPAALEELDAQLTNLENLNGVERGSTGLYPLIESALGIVNAADLARCTRVVGLCLGAADLSHDLGVEPASDPQGIDPLLHARGAMVLASRAAGLVGPIDSVCTNIANPDAAEAEARRARRLGFSGKSLIHPRQLRPIHIAFNPSDTELATAQLIADAWNDARKAGQSTTTVDGQFVDAPIAARAQHILKEHVQ